MATPDKATERRFAAIVKTLTANHSVEHGPKSGKGFGSSALKIDGRIFAMLSSKGNFVVKLPKARVAALVTSGVGEQFDPGHGRKMKEWLSIEPTNNADWLPLAKEALAFVESKA